MKKERNVSQKNRQISGLRDCKQHNAEILLKV